VGARAITPSLAKRRVAPIDGDCAEELGGQRLGHQHVRFRVPELSVEPPYPQVVSKHMEGNLLASLFMGHSLDKPHGFFGVPPPSVGFENDRIADGSAPGLDRQSDHPYLVLGRDVNNGEEKPVRSFGAGRR
jgi:hypothetical protein